MSVVYCLAVFASVLFDLAFQRAFTASYGGSFIIHTWCSTNTR